MENPGRLATSTSQTPRHRDDSDIEHPSPSSATASVDVETITAGWREGRRRLLCPESKRKGTREEAKAEGRLREGRDTARRTPYSTMRTMRSGSRQGRFAGAGRGTWALDDGHRRGEPCRIGVDLPLPSWELETRVCIAASSGPGDSQDTATDRSYQNRSAPTPREATGQWAMGNGQWAMGNGQ